MRPPSRASGRRRGSSGRAPRKAARGRVRNGFEALLVSRKASLLKVLSGLEKEGLRERSASGDTSSLPLHLADLATDTFEQDLALGRVEDVTQEIRTIDQALARIKEGTYGICEHCSEKISHERLKAIPYTQLCLACQRREEERS